MRAPCPRLQGDVGDNAKKSARCRARWTWQSLQTRAQLTAYLKHYELQYSGKKQQLVDRLWPYVERQRAMQPQLQQQQVQQQQHVLQQQQQQVELLHQHAQLQQHAQWAMQLHWAMQHGQVQLPLQQGPVQLPRQQGHQKWSYLMDVVGGVKKRHFHGPRLLPTLRRRCLKK